MMKSMLPLGLVIAIMALLGACANISLTPEGEQVEVMQQRLAVLDQCKKLGNVRTSADNINIREERKDREILARNSAADMGGDVVVPMEDVQEDKSQRWEVYKCN